MPFSMSGSSSNSCRFVFGIAVAITVALMIVNVLHVAWKFLMRHNVPGNVETKTMRGPSKCAGRKIVVAALNCAGVAVCVFGI